MRFVQTAIGVVDGRNALSGHLVEISLEKGRWILKMLNSAARLICKFRLNLNCVQHRNEKQDKQINASNKSCGLLLVRTAKLVKNANQLTVD